jgi:hypothetical protein
MFTDFLTLIEVGEVLGIRFEKAGLIVAARDKDSFFTPGTRRGAFENIKFNLLDLRVLAKVEKDQETIGIPNGMGTRPYNIHNYKWELLKITGSKYTTKHNYFITSKVLLEYYCKAAVEFIVKWADFYQSHPGEFVDALYIIQRNDRLLKHVYNSIENIDNYILPMWEKIAANQGL